MVIFFEEKDLVSFGNFVLSDDRKNIYEEDNKQITAQDLEVWALTSRNNEE